ncbi:hypothetical protein KJZ61_00920 [Candidatus Dependentiae bacterium]|nr:hypothetical protein [Candidatus Dependentiae bacterium]
MIMHRKILGLLFAVHSAAGVIQQFGVGGYSIFCKPGARAREVGDDPILSPLQFHYITQDNYSCLIKLHPQPLDERGARVAILTFEERYQRDKSTRKTLKMTPVEHGMPGNYQFMYITRGDHGQMLFGFVDYGNNEVLRSFLQSIKSSNHSVLEEEREKLRTRPPLSLPALRRYAEQSS